MVLQHSIIVQLDKYGVDGYIAVGYPPLSRIAKAQQISSARMVKFDKQGEPTVDSSKALEADLVMNVLQYIEEAPFELMSVEAFFKFTDELDAKRRGSGEELFKEIGDAIENVKNGTASPSPDSQAAETVSSE
jgi:hypothetical protein